jgi:16S rRNA (cytidine1402-2'-O)-methyltransferase
MDGLVLPMSESSSLPHRLAVCDRIIGRLALQNWPESTLYVVATPIGNLADLSLRAWYALSHVNVIAAEDTRSSKTLIQAWGIDTPLMAAHRHNERQAAQQIIQRLEQGQRVALISDAGAPAISDPGGHLVQDVRSAGFNVIALPGPNAAITALMATGATTDEHPMFCFMGFLPTKSAGRQRALQPWLSYEGALVMYEAPHRLAGLISDLVALFAGHRRISLAKELTKRFEQVATLSLDQAMEWLVHDPMREQGEYVVVLHPPGKNLPLQDDVDMQWLTPERQAWMSALLSQLSTRDAAKLMSQALGQPKDICYRHLIVHAKLTASGQ